MKKLFKKGATLAPKMVGAIALLTALGASSAAQATTYNLGTLSSGLTPIAYTTVAPGAFSDTFNFSLSSFSVLSGGVGALNFSIPFLDVLHIDGLKLELFDASNHSLAVGGLTVAAGSQPFGSYHAVVSGTATGYWGGAYSGALSVSPATAPVPEPETYALMLAGLGLVAWISRRRNKTGSALIA